MAIQVRCVCSKVSQLPDGLAVRRGRCRGCGGAVAVPTGIKADATAGRSAPARLGPADAVADAQAKDSAVAPGTVKLRVISHTDRSYAISRQAFMLRRADASSKISP
jgi:hypothetical protein